jgi:hypothetical protein
MLHAEHIRRGNVEQPQLNWIANYSQPECCDRPECGVGGGHTQAGHQPDHTTLAQGPPDAQ